MSDSQRRQSQKGNKDGLEDFTGGEGQRQSPEERADASRQDAHSHGLEHGDRLFATISRTLVIP